MPAISQEEYRAAGPRVSPLPTWPLLPTWGHILGLQAEHLVPPVGTFQPGCGWQGRFPPHLCGWEKVILEEFFLRRGR